MHPLILALCFLTTLALNAQEASAGPAPAQATVTYAFDWPQGIPWTKYSIEVRADGKAHFDGIPHPDASNNDTDPVQQDFTMSETNCQTILGLAQKLNYFQGDLDAHIKHIAQTGRKTLRYESPQAHGSNTFNWSENPDVKELTQLFSGIANTIDYGRKLEFQYRFDKLGMAQRLKELEELRGDQQIAELHLIEPILRRIADDPNVMNIARESARHLLQSKIVPPINLTR
jgi:hypothetical protein